MAQPGQFPTLDLAPTLEPLFDDPGELRSVIERLASMHFRHVQLSATQRGLRPRDLDAAGRRDLLALFRRQQLSINGLDLWIPGTHLLDPATIDRAMDAVKNAVQMAEDFGRIPVSMVLPAALEKSSAASTVPNSGTTTSNADTTPEISASTVAKAIAAMAEHHGVPIADHAVPAARRECIGIGIDPPAWLSQQLDPAQACVENAGNLVSARLCDLLTTGHRASIGAQQNARLDWATYGFSLAATGYRRAVVVDARQWLNPWQGIQQTATVWCQVIGGQPA